MIYLDLLETAYEHDLAVARAEARRVNILSRQTGSAYNLTDEQFTERYRLSKSVTRQLIAEITPHPHLPSTVRSDALDVETKMLVALSFYATGSHQTIVGDDRSHCVSQASVSKAVREVTMALNKPSILNKYVSFPFQREERDQKMREFYRQFKMPGVLACIDGTHVSIIQPAERVERFYNRKAYYSLNVLIMCDSNLNIMCVDSSFPGNTRDSIIWARHPLNAYLDRAHRISGEDVYVLGDSGYSLRPNTMVPLSTDPAPGTADHYYQTLHVTARYVVERCIGVLKARFRCLLVDRKLHYTPETAARITNACCVLHNIAHRANLPYTPLTREEAQRERELTEAASPQPEQTEAASPQPEQTEAASPQPEQTEAASPQPEQTEAATPQPEQPVLVPGILSDLELGRARQQALIARVWADRRQIILTP